MKNHRGCDLITTLAKTRRRVGLLAVTALLLLAACNESPRRRQLPLGYSLEIVLPRISQEPGSQVPSYLPELCSAWEWGNSGEGKEWVVPTRVEWRRVENLRAALPLAGPTWGMKSLVDFTNPGELQRQKVREIFALDAGLQPAAGTFPWREFLSAPGVEATGKEGLREYLARRATEGAILLGYCATQELPAPEDRVAGVNYHTDVESLRAELTQRLTGKSDDRGSTRTSRRRNRQAKSVLVLVQTEPAIPEVAAAPTISTGPRPVEPLPEASAPAKERVQVAKSDPSSPIRAAATSLPSPETSVSPEPAAAPPGALQPSGPGTPVLAETASIRDPFYAIRRTSITPREDSWLPVGEALRHLETLTGATYNPEFGVITLHGKPSQGFGPFHLDDLMVALKTVFFEKVPLAVSIDPNPADLRGPFMLVRHEGGGEDTALGWLMFESDRLLKGISQGRDSITNAEIHPAVPDFLNMLELGAHFGEHDRWNRFWITFDRLEGKRWFEEPQRSNATQPLLLETADRNAVEFDRCELYVRTQVMVPENGKLVPKAGSSSKAAERFADHFSANYDKFGAIYPEIARLKAIAPLMMLAEWLERIDAPLDLESIRNYRPQVPVLTPRTTPAHRVSLSFDKRVDGGIERTTIESYGGVDFEPRTFFEADKGGRADKHRDFAKQELQRHDSEVTWVSQLDTQPTRVVVMPTLQTNLNRRAERRAKGIVFRRLRDGLTAPDAEISLPPSSAITSERIGSVPVQECSLEAIDRLRAQWTRGPPKESSFAVLSDQRFIGPRTARISFVPVQPFAAVLNEFGRAQSGRSPPVRIPHQFAEAVPPSGLIDNVPFGRAPPRRGEPNTLGSASSEFSPRPERMSSVPVEPLPSGQEAKKSLLGLPVFVGPDNQSTYNLPRLRIYHHPRHTPYPVINGIPRKGIELASHISIVSPLGDINESFGEALFEGAGMEPFYPPKPSPVSHALRGYYAKTRRLEFTSGMSVEFDEKGNPVEITMPEGDSLRFEYPKSSKRNAPEPESCIVASQDGSADGGSFLLTTSRTTFVPDP